MAGGGARIVSDCVNYTIGDMEFAGVALPKVVLRKLVADDRLQFFSAEQRQDRSREDDMALPGNVVEGGVELWAVLRLVKRDRDIQLEPSLDLVKSLAQFGVAIGIKTVSGFE